MVRFKNRYFSVEVVPVDNQSCLKFNKYEIMQGLQNWTEKIHGEFGAAAIRNGLDIKYSDENTRILIIRTRHGPHRLLASTLPFISNIGKRKVQIHGIYTGATMTKCFRALKAFHQERLGDAFKNFITDEILKQSIYFFRSESTWS
uniref:Ribonuclease P/MRP protein subunit POP5 n=1 Tax=Scapholeberis mucronata TaxID=202097 RepID=A0A4Y7NMZ4_9CRUS|nr:EOG090X0GYO [Scapholeberis mucronata]SVE93967.1 EOG090X0GYO [Scapholeberis mucronata]